MFGLKSNNTSTTSNSESCSHTDSSSVRTSFIGSLFTTTSPRYTRSSRSYTAPAPYAAKSSSSLSQADDTNFHSNQKYIRTATYTISSSLDQEQFHQYHPNTKSDSTQSPDATKKISIKLPTVNTDKQRCFDKSPRVGDIHVNENTDRDHTVNLPITSSHKNKSKHGVDELDNCNPMFSSKELLLSSCKSAREPSAETDLDYSMKKSVHLNKMGSTFFIKQTPSSSSKKGNAISDKRDLRKSNQSTKTVGTCSTSGTGCSSDTHTQNGLKTTPLVTRLYLSELMNDSNDYGGSSSSSKTSFRVVSSRDGTHLRLTPTEQPIRGISALFPMISSDE